MTHCSRGSFGNQASAEESIMQDEQCEIPDETEILLIKFKALTPEADELHKCLEKVIEDCQKKHSEDMDNLNQLMLALNKAVKLWQGKKGRPHLSSTSFQWLSFNEVKVYPVVAGKTCGAHKEILKKVKVTVCTDPSDCDVVVVFCPVISRVSSDVDDALRKIPGAAATKRVILVAMHHSRKDINPPELNHGHQNIILDLHVVFHETVNGLLKCERNERAIQSLQEMFKNFQT